MQLADTDPQARRRQLDAYRAMAPAQRVAVALELSEEVRRIALDGIRGRNPALDEAGTSHQWFAMLHGPELAEILSSRGAISSTSSM